MPSEDHNLTNTSQEAETPNQEQQSESQNQTDNSQNTGMAIVANIIFFVPLLTDAKDDPFVTFHVKQGLVLFIYWISVWIISIPLTITIILAWIPFVLNIFGLILLVMGIINAAQGKKKELPIIGKYGKQFDF